MKKLTIRIPIEPVAKGRPRFTRFGGTYTPAKTKAYEAAIAEYYSQCAKEFKFEKGVPLHVTIYFGMPIPKSTPKKMREKMKCGEICHTKRADIDNLSKSILDALNGIAWEDDSQIVSLNLKKQYSEEPHIWLLIMEEENA